MPALSGRRIFSVRDTIYTWEDVVLAGILWGDWDALEGEVRAGLACLKAYVALQVLFLLGRSNCAYCAVRKIGDTPTGTAQSGGEPERGGGPPLSVGVRGEGRALALCRVQGRGPSPRTKQRGERCSQYSALRSIMQFATHRGSGLFR